MTITHSRLLEVVEYNKETGIMASRVDRKSKFGGGRSVSIGQKIGSLNNKGYLQATIDGRTYLVHRLAWLYEKGVFPVDQLDHVDGNRTNNSLLNLRECSQLQNNQNVSKQQGVHTSKSIGVCYVKSIDYWVSYVRFNGRQYHKYFKTEQEAIHGRSELKERLHKFNPVDREAA